MGVNEFIYIQHLNCAQCVVNAQYMSSLSPLPSPLPPLYIYHRSTSFYFYMCHPLKTMLQSCFPPTKSSRNDCLSNVGAMGLVRLSS